MIKQKNKQVNEELMLYPNCSEVVWRLKLPDKRTIKEKIVDALMEIDIFNKEETDTSSFPNDCLDNMIDTIEEAKKLGISSKDIELELLDNIGGGGDGGFIEDCFVIALEHAEGKITENQAKKKERKLWEGEEDLNPYG